MLFHSSKLKIERANKHINDLAEWVLLFSKSDFYRLGIEFDANTGKNLLCLQFAKPIPANPALMIGDCVHNLRSALDLMMCEIVQLKGGKVTKYTRLPFQKTRDKLVSSIDGGIKKTIGPAIFDICDLIVNTVKPYRGGNDTLYAIHDLDIADKHRLLIPVLSVMFVPNIRAEDDHGGIIHGDAVVDDIGRLQMVSTPNKITIKSHGNPTFNIGFGKGQPRAGKPVIPTLHHLSEVTSKTLDVFENYIA
jgi:hypothetical protein